MLPFATAIQAFGFKGVESALQLVGMIECEFLQNWCHLGEGWGQTDLRVVGGPFV